MMLKTHLAIAIFIGVLFVPHITYQTLFIVALLTSTILPDIDTPYSSTGKYKILKPLQFFIKHRGIIHSFTLGIILSIITALFLPRAAFGFFLGYSIHLFADSFTKEGIKPFWPIKKQASWKIKTGGYTESSIFVVFLLADVLLIFLMII